MRGEDCVPASGGPIGRGPVAVGEIVVIGGVLDHAVQRDVFDDFELSHLSPRVGLSGDDHRSAGRRRPSMASSDQAMSRIISSPP